MLSRRVFVGKLAAGAAGAAVALTAGVGSAKAMAARTASGTWSGTANGEGGSPEAAELQARAASEPVVEKVVPPPPWEVLSPLAAGSVVAHGWKVAELSGVEDGSFVLTLANERGRRGRVHVCRNDGRPQGLIYTDQFDLVVMNGGQGDVPTEEDFAQAVAEVAHVLAANEGGLEHRSLVSSLLPHAERLELASAKLR